MDWKNGYVINMEYVHGVHRELSPTALNLILLTQSIEPVALQDRFNYCDLGCGQGDSINLFAACHPEGRFHAVDFNSQHIAGAQNLAKQAQLDNITFWDTDFSDLEKLDLPEFDFIVMHGVYTWVGAESRQHIMEFLKTRLKPGGAVYVSYNSLPGWNVHAPLRELLVTYADTQTGSLEQRIDLAIEFVKRLKTAQASIFETGSTAKDFFEYICTLPRNYLAHEFFNRDWALFYHADVVQNFNRVQLSFAGSANFAENQDLLRFSEEQQGILDSVTDKSMRETLKDYSTKRLLRRDLFTRERNRLSSAIQWTCFRSCSFALALPPTRHEFTKIFPVGEVLFDRALYEPILRALEQRPFSLDELMLCREVGVLGMARVLEALIMLLSAEIIMPAIEPCAHSLMATKNLNQALLAREVDNLGEQVLASPVLQNAIKVTWLERLFVMCTTNDEPDPLLYVRKQIEENRARLDNDEKLRHLVTGNHNELAAELENFRSGLLPFLCMLKIL